ncbi:hypothetical protein BSR29_06090 [Boudabousia liubingyangii]|uniref:DivIVA domain-containing protein n=1 Tax=Boudabousia liubingyangii TaxID=1921764 RepID=A0A1Q5PKM6_9ACTO|nr:DivIVA domain-containing protein [Boudabousia liubingyangii]OKL47188.1 hypothetical protein BSR29_06090 [Boudabousia liubingyangii]
MFSRVGSLRKGYSVAEVDAFLEEARAAYEGDSTEVDANTVLEKVFKEERGGYSRVEVDTTLDRLIAAFVKRDRADFVNRNGQQAWLDFVAERAATLYPRLLAEAGQRFPSPKRGYPGYRRSEVDEFMNVISAFFNDGSDLTANDVRTVVFRSARGSKAYDEAVVDAYLNRVLEVMLAVE